MVEEKVSAWIEILKLKLMMKTPRAVNRWHSNKTILAMANSFPY